MVVSWISFVVPPDVIPGRMALLITLFLVLVNIFNTVNNIIKGLLLFPDCIHHFFIANVIHGKMAPLVYFMSLFIEIFNAINIPHITSYYTSPVQHIIFEVFISMLQYGANAPKISNDDIDITIRWQLTNNKKVTTNTPKAEGLTAIEAWMLSCILFVFGALVGKELFL